MTKRLGAPHRVTTTVQVYSADEAFVTGTFGGITPVKCVDGRVIGSGRRGALTAALQQLYQALMERESALGRMGQAAKRAEEEEEY